MSEITLSPESRANLEIITDPGRIRELTGNRAKQALLITLDFSKPPSPEREALFGTDCDVFDLQSEFGRICAELRDKYSVTTDIWFPTPCGWVLPLEPEGKISYPRHSSIITHDSPVGSYVREHLGGDWSAYHAALVRLGLDGGGIYSRQCESCKQQVRSCDPAVTRCRSCAPRPPDPKRPAAREVWEKDGFRAKLPPLNSVEEVERLLKRIKLVWAPYCCSPGDINAPDFATDAIGWFFYEGLYGCFDAESFLAGAVLTAAEDLVRDHGYAWRFGNGEVFLNHPGLDTPLKVADLLADFGDHLRPEEDFLSEPDLEQHRKNAIRTLSRRFWPEFTPDDVAEACRRAEMAEEFCGGDGAKKLAAAGEKELQIDYATRSFEFRTPGMGYYGEFRYRDGHWLALITDGSFDFGGDSDGDESMPPIIAAAEAGDVAELKRLTDENPRLLNFHGGDFDLTSFSVATPLVAAAENGHLEAVRFLLERGAKPVKKPHLPCPALLRAAANGHLEIITLLLEHGVLPEPAPKKKSIFKNPLAILRDEFMNDAPTALIEAARHNHPEIIRLLLEHGADPMRRIDLTQATALHEGYCFPEVVEVLLKAGVPVDVRDKSGKTPLHQAALFGTLLDAWQGQNLPEENLEEARNYRRAVGNLLAHGADINARDKDGRTPLHIAAEDGSGAYIQSFLDRGADPLARDSEGKTPFDYAEERDNAAGIELLQR